MHDHMNIPNKLHVGFQERSDTYTGKLGYVIYTDEKGKRRKEGSWNGWRSDNISPLDVDNTPTSGFVLNRKAGGVGSGWGWNDRVEKVRVYDPRDFEFEISIPNLLFILSECNAIKGKGLEGEFVYAWVGTELVLLPVTSQEYKTSVEYTAAKSKKVTKTDMVEGCVYINKDLEQVVYLGRLEYRKEINRESVLNGPDTKGHIFYNMTSDGWVFERGFTNLSSKVSDDIHPEYAELYTKFMNSKHVAPFEKLELVAINTDPHYFYGIFLMRVDGELRGFRVNDEYDPVVMERRKVHSWGHCTPLTEEEMNAKLVFDESKFDDPEYVKSFDRTVRNSDGYLTRTHVDRRFGIWKKDPLMAQQKYTLQYKLTSGQTIKVENYVS